MRTTRLAFGPPRFIGRVLSTVEDEEEVHERGEHENARRLLEDQPVAFVDLRILRNQPDLTRSRSKLDNGLAVTHVPRVRFPLELSRAWSDMS